VAKQETLGAQQAKEIRALTASLKEQASQIQKVSAELQLHRSAPQTVLNNQ
jgi:aspartate ammonia-lyase